MSDTLENLIPPLKVEKYMNALQNVTETGEFSAYQL